MNLGCLCLLYHNVHTYNYTVQSNKEDLMKFLDSVLQTLGTDPSMHDLLVVRLSEELKEENVEEVVKELVDHVRMYVRTYVSLSG